MEKHVYTLKTVFMLPMNKVDIKIKKIIISPM